VDHDAYLTGIAELYAAEVLGEGLASFVPSGPQQHLAAKADAFVNFIIAHGLPCSPQLIKNPMAGFIQ
jgi:hypothetical protein